MFRTGHSHVSPSFVCLCDFSWAFLWCSWEKVFWQYWQLSLHLQAHNVGRVVGQQAAHGFACGLTASLVDDPVVTQFVRLREALAAYFATEIKGKI